MVAQDRWSLNTSGHKTGFTVTAYVVVIKFFFVIERTRDLIYLKFVATDFFLKIISPSAGENSGDLA